MISEVLFLLLKKGAHREPVTITTNELAGEAGISQQSASRHLIALEKEEKIRRKGSTVSVTLEGVKEAREVYSELKNALGEKSKLVFSGKVVSGVQEGKYYLSFDQYANQIKEKLGFLPYPGTLNVRVPLDDIEKRLHLRNEKPIMVDGFQAEGRTFGSIACYPCKIDGVRGAIIFPERSHHGLDVIEIIAPVFLRKKLSLKDESKITVKVI